jgi:hypothetical protein
MWNTLKLLLPAGVAAAALLTAIERQDVAQAASPSDGGDWRILAVPDLGTRVQYPAAIFAVPQGSPEKGIGERLSTPDGRATLSVYSRPNDTGDTPATYLKNYLRMPRGQLQYQRVAPSFFAISAVKDDTIYYSRCNFSRSGNPAIHCLDLVYPAREKRAWDAIVTRISRSLRPLQG